MKYYKLPFVMKGEKQKGGKELVSAVSVPRSSPRWSYWEVCLYTTNNLPLFKVAPDVYTLPVYFGC